jgi:uncharacterized RDD family membrane protein YckC
VAQAIDLVLVFLIVILLHAFWRIPAPLFKWILLWTYLIYSVLMDCYYDGTIGKLYLNMKVIRTSDNRSKLLTSFYRNLIKIFLGFLLFDSILILAVVGHLGIHNKIAGCAVVDGVGENATAANKVYES